MITDPELYNIVDKPTRKKLTKIISELTYYSYRFQDYFMSDTQDVVKFISDNTRIPQYKVFDLLKQYADYLCFKWEYGVGSKKIPGTFGIMNFKQCARKRRYK